MEIFFSIIALCVGYVLGRRHVYQQCERAIDQERRIARDWRQRYEQRLLMYEALERAANVGSGSLHDPLQHHMHAIQPEDHAEPNTDDQP